MRMEEKKERLRDILKELCGGGPMTVKKPRKHNGEVHKSVIRYHGPYVDACGECFYLPGKWHCNDSKKTIGTNVMWIILLMKIK